MSGGARKYKNTYLCQKVSVFRKAVKVEENHEGWKCHVTLISWEIISILCHVNICWEIIAMSCHVNIYWDIIAMSCHVNISWEIISISCHVSVSWEISAMSCNVNITWDIIAILLTLIYLGK